MYLWIVEVQFECNMLVWQVRGATQERLAAGREAREMLSRRRRCSSMASEVDFDDGTVILEAWTDSAWAGVRRDRKSQSTLHIEADKVPRFGTSRRLAAIAGSSAETELRAAASGSSEAMMKSCCLQAWRW